MKNTLEKIAVMQAFVDKKTIEYKQENTKHWEKCDKKELTWDWSFYDYRIKQKPEYQPFDFSDAESLIGNIVKLKSTSALSIITNVNPRGVTASKSIITYKNLFEKYEFTDGSLCGKLK